MVNAAAYSAQQLTLFGECERPRGGRYPRYFVWENVPGAFSSNKGMDFRAVLEEIGQTEIPMPPNGKWANAGLAELRECQIAWRVLDAQYFGVPQRRRRIFLVADFAADGRCAGEILFEREGMSWNPAESKGAGEGASRGTADCARIALYDIQHRDDVIRPIKDGNVPTLTARMGTGGHNVPIVLQDGRIYKLTPTECERLQGLPDGYTEGGSDTARYKALGNGMAQPCADYVIRRIVEETKEA